jgi:type IV pilus assembly protein PilE
MKTSSSPQHHLSGHKGFSLIELMVVVAIIAILSKIALPAYGEYITRGKFPEATANLVGKQLSIEQYYLDNRTYVGAPGCASDTASSTNFSFACSASDASSYQLDATGKNSMVGFAFTIDQSNAKTTSAVATGWSMPSPNNCWISKKGGAC